MTYVARAFNEVEDQVSDHIVLVTEYLDKLIRHPLLYDGQVDLRHIHLRCHERWKLGGLKQTLVDVRRQGGRHLERDCALARNCVGWCCTSRVSLEEHWT